MFTPSRLILARQKRGLSKKDLAELIGVTAQSISNFESEITKCPKFTSQFLFVALYDDIELSQWLRQ